VLLLQRRRCRHKDWRCLRAVSPAVILAKLQGSFVLMFWIFFTERQTHGRLQILSYRDVFSQQLRFHIKDWRCLQAAKVCFNYWFAHSCGFHDGALLLFESVFALEFLQVLIP
jgi:hypothetical protein